MRLKILSVILLVLASASFAADMNYPYGNIRLNLPPSKDPSPGFGTFYSTVSKGMQSALWNPASLGRLPLSEASIAVNMAPNVVKYTKETSIEEKSGTMEVTQGGGAGATYAIFYRYPSEIGSGIATQEVKMLSSVDYATSSTGINFSSAIKVNDWLTVGIASNNPAGAVSNMAGDFPTTFRYDTNLYGQTLGDMQVSNDGKAKITFTDQSGGVTTYESINKIWSGFLSQEATIPFTTISEFRNNVNIESPFTSTFSAKIKNGFVGLNIIPISATANIDNDLRTVIPADTPDQFLYSPDFDPASPTEVPNWVNDPDRYSTQNGYKKKQVLLPAGEIVATAKYKGYYSGSTARFDLGGVYDVNEWFTIGLVLENATGSNLNLKGNGLTGFISYREINTAEANNLGDIMRPGGKSTVDLITQRWITTFEAGNTKFLLEPEKNIELPKKIRYGFSLKRPFLIAIDFEQNSTPIKYMKSSGGTVTEVTISNFDLLRIGMESMLFRLPVRIRSGFTFLAKPSSSDPDLQRQIDNAYNNRYVKIMFGYMPAKADLGFGFNLWGTEVDTAFGANGLSLLSMAQLDTSNVDLGKLAYYTLSFKKDAWEVSYLNQVDPGATAVAFNSKTVPAGQDRQFEPSDVKFVQTLGVTYRF